MNRMNAPLWMAILSATLLGCGSGGGGGGSNLAGIDRLGASTGTVTGFGSIFVNGVEFETSGAQFTIDDSAGSESDLSIGDVVVVTGSIDANGSTGTAATVFADEAVEGPIDAIDAVAGQLVVAGQTVLVDGSTAFDDGISPASLDGLAAGNFVEVSGFFDGDGVIRATRIERKAANGIPAGEQIEVHGVVANLSATTFTINALTVDFSQAVLEDFPSGMISDGDFVEAKGSSLGGSGELLASEVDLEVPGIGGLDLDDIDDFEIEGFITRFVSASDFDVSGIPVTTTAQTVFEFEDDSPASAADLALNVKVEVEGEVNASDVLVADKIDIKRAAAVRITARVDSVDAPNDRFLLLGVTVRTDALTRLEDKSDIDDENFTLSELMAGDYVEMRGSPDVGGGADIIAERVEREDSDNETIIQGFVEAVNQPSLTILGVTIDTNAQTRFERDDGTLFANADAFFNAVAVGSLVQADGTEVADTTLLADEVELDNEN